MEIKEFKVNGKDVKFVNNEWSTSQAWGHQSTLFIDGSEFDTHKVRYYNRTWECYRFQTCMRGLVNGLMEQRYHALIDTYKEENNIGRLTSKKKEEFVSSVLENDSYYVLYKNILKEL